MSKDNNNGGRDWNSSENIATQEYSSIINAFYETVLRPMVQGHQNMDRDALEMIASDLSWKVEDDEFEKLPFKIRNAYNSLLNLVNVIKETDDVTLAEHRNLLEGYFSLGICCSTYGSSMKEFYKGRNPCRESQVVMYSSLAKARRRAEEKGMGLPLLEASGQMFDVCKKCPYK